MGGFDEFVYDGSRWVTAVEGTVWLRITVHDSDIAEVTFTPSYGARGLVYLGFQPRDYFEDPSASPEIDLAAESDALARWAAELGNPAVTPHSVRALVAEPDSDPDDDFVEETVIRLLKVLGIPEPPALQV